MKRRWTLEEKLAILSEAEAGNVENVEGIMLVLDLFIIGKRSSIPREKLA